MTIEIAESFVAVPEIVISPQATWLDGKQINIISSGARFTIICTDEGFASDINSYIDNCITKDKNGFLVFDWQKKIGIKKIEISCGGTKVWEK